MPLNETFEIKDVPQDAPVTPDSLLDGSISSIIDGTKTMVISKNRTRPNLPEARTERNHHRRNTFSVDEDNEIATDVANMINAVKAVVADDDADSFRCGLQHQLAMYLLQKEEKHAQELLSVRRRAEVMRNSLVMETSLSDSNSTSLSMDASIDEPIDYEKTKAEVREKHIESLRLIGLLAQEAENFTIMEKTFLQDENDYNEIQDEYEKLFSEVHQRYNDLLKEGQTKCELINNEIEKIQREHNEANVLVQNSIKSSEIAIKGLETNIADLNREKTELLALLDEVIEKNDDQLAEA